MQDQRTIEEWSRHFKFTNRAMDKVHSITQKYGVGVVTTIFEDMEEDALVGAEGRIQQFQRISEAVIREYNRSWKTREFDKKYEANEVASKKSHQEGYRPTPEVLRAQIEELYDRGEISLQEYEWGIKGLQTVFDLVDAAQEEPVEEAEIPFFAEEVGIPEEELTAAQF